MPSPLASLFNRYHKGSPRSLPRRIYQSYLRSPRTIRWHFGMRIAPESNPPRYRYNVATILLKWVVSERLARFDNPRLLEIGVGAYALLAGALSREWNLEVDGVEVEEALVDSARRHAILNDARVHVYHSNIYSGLPKEKRYDLVFWNTPYHIDSRRFLPALFAGSPERLTEDGELVICYKTSSNRAETLEILSEYPSLEAGERYRWWWCPIEVLVIRKRKEEA